jgi:Flp pilus assembly protein CpaB
MTRWPTLRTPGRGDADDGTATGNGNAPKLRTRGITTATAAFTGPSWLDRLRQPLPLLGGVLVLIALIGYLAVYSAANHRTGVLVLTRAMPAGSTLQASDLNTERLAAPATVLVALEPSTDLQQAVGHQLQTSVTAGEPLTRAAITSQPGRPSAFTLTVPASTTEGEGLVAGDRITVLGTFGTGTGQVSTRVLARDLEVLSVGQPPADSNLTSTTVPVTVALTDVSVVAQLALSNEDGKIDLLRDGQRASTAVIPNATETGTGAGS